MENNKNNNKNQREKAKIHYFFDTNLINNTNPVDISFSFQFYEDYC